MSTFAQTTAILMKDRVALVVAAVFNAPVSPPDVFSFTGRQPQIADGRLCTP